MIQQLCINADYHFTVAGTIAAFICNPGEIIELDLLCDGTAHCSAGDDETVSLCESMFYTV